jgi:hypothetical protein
VSALAACCEKRNGLKTILSTCGLIFLAKLGDRTQLACIGLTCKARSPLAVFLGAVGALAVVALIGVILGRRPGQSRPDGLYSESIWNPVRGHWGCDPDVWLGSIR